MKMMKRENSTSSTSSSSSGAARGLEARYKGVRKRKWGKYVSEIRLPNSRERIWLGSYESAEKAAKAFDAAMYCLRGRKAATRLNFPLQIPDIPLPRPGVDPPLSHSEIQLAAAKFAHASSHGQNTSEAAAAPPTTTPPAARAQGSKAAAAEEMLMMPSSPAPTGSEGSSYDEGSTTLTADMHLDDELATLDWSFLDLPPPPEDLLGGFTEVNHDFRGFDLLFPPPPPPAPAADDGEYLQPSFLWDF